IPKRRSSDLNVAQTGLSIKIENVDFAKNEVGKFTSVLGSVDVSGGKATVTSRASSGSTGGSLAYILNNSIPSNQIWYVRVRTRVLDGGASRLILGFHGTSGGNERVL